MVASNYSARVSPTSKRLASNPVRVNPQDEGEDREEESNEMAHPYRERTNLGQFANEDAKSMLVAAEQQLRPQPTAC